MADIKTLNGYFLADMQARNNITTLNQEVGYLKANGFSPVANVQQTADGATITIKDKSGTTTATVKHGKEGHSPEAWTERVEGGVQLVVYDKNGPTETTIYDGKSAYQYAQDGGYTGTEEEFAAKLAIPVITPEMYGAKGDGVTDDSAAIQAAIDAAGKSYPVYLAKKNYAISTGLTINTGYASFTCEGELIYSGTGAAITIANANRVTLKVYVIRAENGTGLLMDSTTGEVGSCIIDVKHIRSSVIGVHLKGNGAAESGYSMFYNKLHLEGGIQSTDTCIYIEAVTTLVNENYFWVGRLFGDATYGIRINATDVFGGDASNGNASRNVFHGGNLEGIADDGFAIHLHNSSQNVFRNFRTEEAYGQYVVGFSGECWANDIELSTIRLGEVDISDLTSSDSYANILRAPRIVGSGNDNLTGQNKIWVSTSGFSCETSDLSSKLSTERWVFALEDGTTIEKQVVAS